MSQRLNQEREFDVLGDVLETLRFRGSIFFWSELAAPWGMSLERMGIPRFHIALAGNCYIGADNNNAVNVQEMGVVMLPSGSSHWIADQPDRKLVPSELAGEACELGNPLFQQGKITNRLMCGLVHFDQEATHPFLDSLPQILHIPKLESTSPTWITITLIEAELRRTKGLGGSIIDRLTEVMFLQLLNHYISEDNEATGFLAALGDRRIQQALSLIHRDLNFDWSLASLGEQIGMSRATLVRRFQEALGVAPMTYVTNWRVMKARSLIKYSNTTLEQIAETVGFGSSRTLNKAFLRHYGYTPNELRRRQSNQAKLINK